jgi:DNA repair protein RadA
MHQRNLDLAEAADSAQQEKIVDNIDSYIPFNNQDSNRFKLLVVDSPVTHYRSEYMKIRENLPTRQQRLYKFMRRLVTIARAYNIAVVVTNQINT